MGKSPLGKLNEHARATGKTQAELAEEIRDALFGEPTGPRKWVDFVRKSLRRPTEADRENRRIFEENQARALAEAARAVSEGAPAAGEADKPRGDFADYRQRLLASDAFKTDKPQGRG